MAGGGRLLSGFSIATTQLPQQPAIASVRAVCGPGREASGYFHTRSELLTTRLARRSFVVRSRRFARWTTTQRYCCHYAFEHNGAASKGNGIAGFDLVRGPHTLAIEVHFTATDRIRRSRTGLEQADSDQPAVDPLGARPCLFMCTHAPRSVIDELKSALTKKCGRTLRRGLRMTEYHSLLPVANGRPWPASAPLSAASQRSPRVSLPTHKYDLS